MCLKWGGNSKKNIVTAPLQAYFYGSSGKWSDNNLCRIMQNNAEKQKLVSTSTHEKIMRAANGNVAFCSPNLCMCESSSRYILNKS